MTAPVPALPAPLAGYWADDPAWLPWPDDEAAILSWPSWGGQGPDAVVNQRTVPRLIHTTPTLGGRASAHWHGQNHDVLEVGAKGDQVALPITVAVALSPSHIATPHPIVSSRPLLTDVLTVWPYEARIELFGTDVDVAALVDPPGGGPWFVVARLGGGDRLLVNGAEVALGALAAPAALPLPLLLGSRSNYEETTRGWVGCVAVWDQALSDADMATFGQWMADYYGGATTVPLVPALNLFPALTVHPAEAHDYATAGG